MIICMTTANPSRNQVLLGFSFPSFEFSLRCFWKRKEVCRQADKLFNKQNYYDYKKKVGTQKALR